MRAWLAMLTLLAACGGGGVAIVTAVAPAPVPAAAPPTASVPAQTASAAEVITTAWSANWRTVLAESWGDPKLGGWIRQDHEPCRGGLADPGSGPVQRYGVPADGWAVYAGAWADFRPAPGGLAIDSLQHAGGGIALLSGLDLDPARPVRITAVLDLQPDDGAWVGLAVHNGEGNYREGGFAWYGGQLRLLVHAPCYVVNVGAVDPGPRLLATEYHPAHGWRVSVDGVSRYTEAIDYRANRLQGQPRAGLWAVNLTAEATPGTTGRVRALVGPLTVQQE